MSKRYRPIRDQVLVKPLARPGDDQVVLPGGVTAGGIIVPNTARSRCDVGEVVACGPGVDPWECAPGMVVRYRHYAGIHCEHEGERHLLLEAAEVIAEELAADQAA